MLLLWPSVYYAQDLNVENVFNSTSENNTEFGINSAYMFHHLLDANYDLSEEIKDLMISHDFDLVRFPGGAIGNYFRLNGTGYGAIKSEVENVENTVQCNGPGFYCFEKDQNAPRNFIYDFLELTEHRYNVTGRKTDLLYVLNLLLHFVYNYDEIDQLQTLNSMSEVDAAHTAGLISDDFHERITENYTAMEMLINSPYIDMKGIEMGNEFYFYQEVTTFPYPPTNSNPFFNLNTALNVVEPRIAKYRTLVAFYKRLIVPIEPAIEIGVPIGGVNHFGNMANADLLWNTAIKQWMMDDLDALIPHMYIKSTGDDLDPVALGAQDDHPDIVLLKEEFEKSLETKFINSMAEIIEFFDLDASFRELWLTEYNVNKNESGTQFWDEWTNTYLHGAFLQEWMKLMAASPISDYMRYVIQHTWSGSNTAYEHCIFTNVSDGVLVNRAAHFANDLSDFLKSPNTKALTGNFSDNRADYDLYTDFYYTYDTAEPGECPLERLIVSFTNLRGSELTTHLEFINDRVSINGVQFDVVESHLKAFKGNSLSSACGRTPFNNDESVYDVSEINVPVDVQQPIAIPGYSSGYIEVVIVPVNNDCLPLAVDDQERAPAIAVYPNPATNLLKLTLPQEWNGIDTEAVITDALGKTMAVEVLESDIVNVEALAPGLYFLHLRTGDRETLATSFVKAR